ncbi:alpha-L-rhamnosidase [Bryocella elongata]|uniref:Alpha-L-rhamnosidase n=1 Tax=Bryocella elongata TaxID=863522 RepID=A0A1H5WIH3_9BACT|nr:glycosyl hydrolase family 28 protein [Bryocella elongata]SEF99195.1 alpha-L-rhamnosidase [Bryocella elongata]
MPSPTYPRRRFMSWMLSAPLLVSAWKSNAASTRKSSITDHGALADGSTVNTRAIQAAIDDLAAHGGGTVIVPSGTFVTGAIFFKPGVNLHLEAGAVLQCSTDVAANFPDQRTRIEGHFEEKFTPALINAKNCDGFQLTGEGTLDGAGRPIWDFFWKLRKASPQGGNFPNIGIPRARLALIENSHGVKIEGVTFKDSQFWNLHIYHCDGVLVHNVRFQVPDDYPQAPSTDGIDLDSSRNVTIDGCYFSVTDDCIACKGSRGPHALEDLTSPPVEHIRVRNCTYKRGGGVLTLGSEATIVRDVLVEDCKITGRVRIATLKLRPDTPQHYEDIHFRNITSEADAPQILTIQPWSQYFDLKGAAPPHSVVRNISLTGVKGHFAAFGVIRPNPGQTEISNILLKDFDVTCDKDQLAASGVTDLKFENVIVNGKPQTGPAA